MFSACRTLPSAALRTVLGAPRARPLLAAGAAFASSLGVAHALCEAESTPLAPKSQLDLAEASESNPTPTEVPAPQRQFMGNLGHKHVISIAGLPNRGKRYVADELRWYLKFFHGAQIRTFDVHDKAYAVGVTREERAELLLKDMEAFLEGGGKEKSLLLDDVKALFGGRGSSEDQSEQLKKGYDSGRVAIVLPFSFRDEEQTTSADRFPKKRKWGDIWSCSNAVDREWVRKRVTATSAKLMFIEIEVTDPALLREHAANLEPKLRKVLDERGDDFARSYTPLGCAAFPEDNLSYLKLKNFRDIETHKMNGYLRMRIAQFLSVLHPGKHCIYLSRHGESQYNVEKKLGGDPELSPMGDAYAKRLGKFSDVVIGKGVDGEDVKARLWTSSLKRTKLTADYIEHPLVAEGTWEQMTPRVYRNLDEIFAGEYDGMTEAEIKKMDPAFNIDRKNDKFGMRYPKGESYVDLITRLEPIIHELHSYKEPILIVSHQATLRMLRAYLMRIDREDGVGCEIPQHTVMKIEWDGWHFPPVKNANMTEKGKIDKTIWPPPHLKVRDGMEWEASAEALANDKQAPSSSGGRGIQEEWTWLGPNTKKDDGQGNL